MSILKGEELDNFVKTVEEIKEFLEKKRAGTLPYLHPTSMHISKLLIFLQK